MYQVIARIDDFGRAAWLALMVLGFIIYWPIGLAILAYIIWPTSYGVDGWDADGTATPVVATSSNGTSARPTR